MKKQQITIKCSNCSCNLMKYGKRTSGGIRCSKCDTISKITKRNNKKSKRQKQFEIFSKTKLIKSMDEI